MTSALHAQQQPQSPANGTPRSEPVGFSVSAKIANSWQDRGASVVTLSGPVIIKTDDSTLQADNAVVWLEADPTTADAQQVSISLIGNARIQTAGATRTADTLYATTLARGNIRFEAQQRVAKDDSASPLFQQATALRAEQQLSPEVITIVQPTTTTVPTTRPTGPKAARNPLADLPAGSGARIIASQISDATQPDGRLALALHGVHVFYHWPDGAYAELSAENAVAFTDLKSEGGPLPALAKAEAGLESIYLEGDVRIIYFPPASVARIGEQRLSADRAYFRIGDRTAVLTEAVLHTEDLKSQMPFVLRARTLKQVSEGNFEARSVQLTTSQFYRPSFAIEASKIYVHRNPGTTASEDAPTSFRAINPRFKFLGVPLFYLPVAGGTATGRGAPIRDLTMTNGNTYGLGVKTTWGLFETVGLEPPRGLDAQYRLDYFDERGPAAGLSGDYRGGFVTDTDKQQVDFVGLYDSYFIQEHGTDNLGQGRAGVDPGYREIRGTAGFQHQHFFPDGWQLQMQSWYVSDATFLEEYDPYEKQFDEGYQRDSSLYLKRQQGNEAFTFLVNAQPNSLVTTADLQQEQFEVEHMPAVGYHLIGAGLGDVATLYSDNSFAGLNMRQSKATLAEQGFVENASTPGIPSLGTTGIAEDPVYRGDFRQEVAFPLSAGQVKVVPYVIGRYTPYSEGTDGAAVNRVYGGLGARFTTAFWKVDDLAYSDLFDIHRMRHVIQPEMNLFAGWSTDERNSVYIFEEPVDDINDISAMQIALHQRWQTKRGGPGRWRSVDVFTLDAEGVFFKRRPEEASEFDGLDEDEKPPADFRGLFYPSLPEASTTRNSINVDGTWRLSDNTVVIGDLSYNLDVGKLSTAAIGLNVQREDRLRYYLGMRYIEPFNAQVATVAVDYQLTPKYIISLNQSYDFGDGENVVTAVTLTRRFDKFYVQLAASYDSYEDERAISFNFVPEGVPIQSATLQNWIPQR